MSELEDRLEDLVSVGEAIVKGLKNPPIVDVTLPSAPAPTVKVEAPQVTLPESPVTVHVPEQAPREPCSFQVEVTEWKGPRGRISKMIITPIT